MAVYTQKYRLHNGNTPGWYSYHDTVDEAKAQYEALLSTYDVDIEIDGTRWYNNPFKTFEILPVLVCDPE
jgi:hypothetical protein